MVKFVTNNKFLAITILVVALAVFTFSAVVIFGNQKSDEGAETSEVEKYEVTDEEIQAQKAKQAQEKIDIALSKLSLSKDFRKSLAHGPKTAANQKYIVLHDTEGDGRAENVVSGWDSNGKGVAAQFVINKDGSIVQCVDMDQIAHHAGFGDTGHNNSYGIVEDGRDDMVGTEPIGSWASDYGMNAWSVGIEMVHVGGSGDYPEAQLLALDNLIAYIDAYYWNSPSGNGGTIIDHKAWRTGNSDTSKEFAGYFASYKEKRTHK